VIWLAYLLTEGDHRQVSVAAYITGMKTTLSHLSAQGIAPLEFSDDRLGHRLTHWRKPPSWHQIERDWNARRMGMDDLAQDVLRWDAPTVSGDHEVPAEGL
jgi:hypothetical protein